MHRPRLVRVSILDLASDPIDLTAALVDIPSVSRDEARIADISRRLDNLLRDHGEAGLAAFRDNYPDLRVETYAADADPVALVNGADLVIVHEWNEPELVAALGRTRRARDLHHARNGQGGGCG